jgi:hypothetical protein
MELILKYIMMLDGLKFGKFNILENILIKNLFNQAKIIFYNLQINFYNLQIKIN